MINATDWLLAGGFEFFDVCGVVREVVREGDHYIVWGRIEDPSGFEVFDFDIDMDQIEEGQRSYLQPGSYVSFPNGHLLVYKTMVSTYEWEQATAEAERLWCELGWG